MHADYRGPVLSLVLPITKHALELTVRELLGEETLPNFVSTELYERGKNTCSLFLNVGAADWRLLCLLSFVRFSSLKPEPTLCPGLELMPLFPNLALTLSRSHSLHDLSCVWRALASWFPVPDPPVAEVPWATWRCIAAELLEYLVLWPLLLSDTELLQRLLHVAVLHQLTHGYVRVCLP